MTDTPNSHKTTPEQWEDAEAFASDTRACLLELRDRITALEQFRESTAAHSLAMGEAMNQATASIASLEQRVRALEPRPWIRPQTHAEIDEGLRAAFRKAIADGVVHPVPHAPAPAAEPAADNGWTEAAIAWECCASIHREYAKGRDPLFTTRQSDFRKHADDARSRLKNAPTATPAPAPPRSLVDAVEARAGGDARSAIREVADWLQRRHTGRIANGSQFAEVLRQEAER